MAYITLFLVLLILINAVTVFKIIGNAIERTTTFILQVLIGKK